MDLEAFQKKADKDKTGNRQFLSKLKQAKPRKLDEAFQAAHDEVFEEMNCLHCANCCKTTSPIFKQKDIENISKRLRITPSAFIQKYLHVDADNDYVLNSSPCPFLDAENYCLVYDDRPAACKEYPHTDRKKIIQLLDLTYKNTFVCPAVLEIVERLKTVKIK